MIKDYIKRCQELNRLLGREDTPVGVMAAIDKTDDEAVKKLFYFLISIMKNADKNDKIRFKDQINELMENLIS